MTTAQIDRAFDIVWQNHWTDAHLCCPEANHPTRRPPVVIPVKAVPFAEGLSHDEIRRLVVAAMPGTVKQLAIKAGIEEKRIYAVLSHLSRRGELVTTKPGKRVCYGVQSLKTSTLPVQYSRIRG